MTAATSRLLAPLAVALVALAIACTTGCPSLPLPSPPVPEAGDGSSPFAANRTAAAVLDDLEASGCSVDGGLVEVEQAHARFDRAPAWDCLFLASGSVSGCGGLPVSPALDRAIAEARRADAADMEHRAMRKRSVVEGHLIPVDVDARGAVLAQRAMMARSAACGLFAAEFIDSPTK